MQKSLAEVTAADIEEIERLAGLFIVPREIARMLEFDVEEFVVGCEMCSSAVYTAFYGGRLQGEVDLRDSIKKMSDAGSVPAQMMMLDLLKQSKIKMIDR